MIMEEEQNAEHKYALSIQASDLNKRGYYLDMKRDLINQGSFGSVFCAIDKNQQKWAVKIISNAFLNDLKLCKKSFNQEGQIYDQINSNPHPNLISLKEKFKTKYKLGQGELRQLKNYYLIMEYVSGGTLHEFIKTYGPLSESKAKVFATDLFNAVLHLHKLSIAHLDIKGENCLVVYGDRMSLKLTDFGVATSDYKTTKIAGSLHTIAPEILRSTFVEQSQRLAYETKLADLWSLGATIYMMLHSYYPLMINCNEEIYKLKSIFSPFDRRLSPYEIFRAVLKPLSSSLSSDARKVLGSLLQADPKVRVHFDPAVFDAWNQENTVLLARFSRKNNLGLWTRHILDNKRVIATAQHLITNALDQHGYQIDMFQDQIGLSKFGAVYRVTQKSNGNEFAVKIFSSIFSFFDNEFSANDSICQENFDKEVCLYDTKHILSESILSLKESMIKSFEIPFENIMFKTYFKVMELATHGTLEQMVNCQGPLSEDVAKILFNDLIVAMQYLHNLKVAHLDIHPSNCFIVFNGKRHVLKLTGFNCATESVSTNQAFGLFETMAPEAIVAEFIDMRENQIGDCTYLTQVADLWSTGATMFFALHQHFPLINKPGDIDLLEEIYENYDQEQPSVFLMEELKKFRKVINPRLSNTVKSILKGLLEFDPKIRQNFDQNRFKKLKSNNLQSRLR